MLMGNPSAVILLSIIIGCANNLSLIGGKAFLLSTAQPVFALYASLASGLLFSLFLKYFRFSKGKFAIFSILGGLLVLILFSALYLPIFSATAMGLGWFFLATLASAFYRWIAIEIALRHLDPVRAQSYFPHIATADEVGTLAAILMLKYYASWLPPQWTIAATLALYLLALGFIALQFLPVRNLEIKFSGKNVPPEPPDARFRPLLLAFIMVTFAFGLFKNSEEYLVNFVLKDSLSSYRAIQNMMANYLAISSVFVIGVSYGVGVLTKKRHLSPVWILLAQPIFLMAMDIACLWTQNLYFFLAFDVGQFLAITCLYTPAMQMVMGFFPERERSRLRSAHNLYFYTLAKIPLVLLFSYTQGFDPALQRKLLLLLILALLTGCYIASMLLGKKLVAILYEFVSSADKTASILATQALSFLRPKNFAAKMKALLSLSPKKVLRKTIILSLRFDQSEDSVETILNEFRSDKEEIQIAVLDALSVAKHYKATQFMYNVVIAREKATSLNVRMNATTILAAMYGKKAIPFLLNGLDDEDPRVAANALETLTTYRDKSLIPVYRRFADSPYPRLKANALMGLASFRTTRKEYQGIVEGVLEGDDENLISSILYVIGKLRDSRFKHDLVKLAGSPRGKSDAIQPSLAWALNQLDRREGLEMAQRLFNVPYQPGHSNPFLHFFSQMKKERRFDIIRYLVSQYLEDDTAMLNLGSHLRNSAFSFHREIEYIHLLRKESGLNTLKVIRLRRAPQ